MARSGLLGPLSWIRSRTRSAGGFFASRRQPRRLQRHARPRPLQFGFAVVDAAKPARLLCADRRRAAPPVDGSALVSERTVVGSQVVRRLRTSAREYPVNEVYVDLLATSGRTSPLTVDDLVGELRDAWESRTQTQMFRTPWLAFVYERGWRQQFRAAGFPGIDAEFAEVNEFFAPAAGGVVVDMSCGSGLMTRRLARSKAYGRLLAVDYSESMLAETRRRCEQERRRPTRSRSAAPTSPSCRWRRPASTRCTRAPRSTRGRASRWVWPRSDASSSRRPLLRHHLRPGRVRRPRAGMMTGAAARSASSTRRTSSSS